MFLILLGLVSFAAYITCVRELSVGGHVASLTWIAWCFFPGYVTDFVMESLLGWSGVALALVVAAGYVFLTSTAKGPPESRPPEALRGADRGGR